MQAKNDDRSVPVVARVMALSMDASDQRRASEDHPYAAVEAFLNSARDDFLYQDDWWQFGIKDSGDIVGVVLPVTFNGCAKGDLEEGTLEALVRESIQLVEILCLKLIPPQQNENQGGDNNRGKSTN